MTYSTLSEILRKTKWKEVSEELPKLPPNAVRFCREDCCPCEDQCPESCYLADEGA